jgi:hypothetical protein
MPLLFCVSIELTNVLLNCFSALKRKRADADDIARLSEQVESLPIENKASEEMYRQNLMNAESQQILLLKNVERLQRLVDGKQKLIDLLKTTRRIHAL